MTMKVRRQPPTASILLARAALAYPGQVKQIEAETDPLVRAKAQLQAVQRADLARLARIARIKAEVDAGTYTINSEALAQTLLAQPIMQEIIECPIHPDLSPA